MRSNIGECRECEAPVVWMVTAKGKNIPVDIDSVSDDEQEDAEAGIKVSFIYGTHICHFNTCSEGENR